MGVVSSAIPICDLFKIEEKNGELVILLICRICSSKLSFCYVICAMCRFEAQLCVTFVFLGFWFICQTPVTSLQVVAACGYVPVQQRGLESGRDDLRGLQVSVVICLFNKLQRLVPKLQVSFTALCDLRKYSMFSFEFNYYFDYVVLSYVCYRDSCDAFERYLTTFVILWKLELNLHN